MISHNRELILQNQSSQFDSSLHFPPLNHSFLEEQHNCTSCSNCSLIYITLMLCYIYCEFVDLHVSRFKNFIHIF